MSKKITNLDQLRTAAVEARGLIGEVAKAAAEAIEELDNKKQDAETAISMEQVNTAIYEAITGAIEEAY